MPALVVDLNTATVAAGLVVAYLVGATTYAAFMLSTMDQISKQDMRRCLARALLFRR